VTTLDAIDAVTVAAFRQGDHDAFARISRRHFRELHVHCYRMVGSYDDAEDLVQETLMRAWNRRESYEGRASIRAWLYRIATNVCIDVIRTRTPSATPDEAEGVPRYSELPWMQPYPDAMLDSVVPDDAQPDARVVERESIELAFLATVQLLPVKQRAVLILRDILDFSAAETASILDDSVAAVNSALQRARATLQKRRRAWADSVETSAATFDEAMLLQVFMDGQERGDVGAIVDLLRDDVRMTLFPDAVVWDGRDDVARELRKKRSDFDGDVRSIPIAANRQPALAVYLRQRNDVEYRAWALVLLGVRGGKVREIATFASPELFTRFQLPPTFTRSVTTSHDG
jgi:RNA polymerase sigma-70 factor (ECF subfamily)